MIGFLSKIFIKNQEDVKNPQVREAYGTLCSIMGIFFNVCLFAGKFFAGMVTGSVAITADAFNNLSDAGSSVITLAGFKFAGVKADDEHPFGHGRIEYLSGLAVSLLILLMGVELAKSSIKKIVKPETIEVSLLAIFILVVSILVKSYMAYYNYRISLKIDSTAMKATATDSLSDCVATSIVLIAMLIVRFTGINIDGISGLFVAVLILYAGYGAAKDTLMPLLGQSPDRKFVDKIEEIAMSYDDIIGVHDLVVHDYGPGRKMVSLHAEVPGDGDIFALHDAVDNAENQIYRELGCETTIHMDPVVVNDQRVNKIRNLVNEIIHNKNENLNMHDFRMVEGPTHTNVIFDLVIPRNLKQTDAEVVKDLRDAIGEIPGNYFAVIKIDKPFLTK